MAHLARTHRLSRRSWLCAGLGICVSAGAFWGHNSPELAPHFDGDSLYVSAPELHFVTGKPLERLMDGDTVIYIAQLSLSLDNNRTFVKQKPQRFIFSRGVWDEKFYVVSGNSPRKQFTSAEKAEAWCLENLAISTVGVPRDKPVWLRLDVRVAEPKDPASLMGDAGLDLATLVKIFARSGRTEQTHWVVDAPPFRLGDLRKTGRG